MHLTAATANGWAVAYNPLMQVAVDGNGGGFYSVLRIDCGTLLSVRTRQGIVSRPGVRLHIRCMVVTVMLKEYGKKVAKIKKHSFYDL